jgi:ubiquinone/menaquinone biosynthesis C-methylase UbiE
MTSVRVRPGVTRFDGVAALYDLIPVPGSPEVLATRLKDRAGPFLDLGGGTGKRSAVIGGGTRTLVVDASGGMLREVRRQGRGVEPVLGHAEALPLASAAFGAVFATEAFHHFGRHQERVLEEAARVLRPDGLLLLEEIDPRPLRGRAAETDGHTVRDHAHFQEPRELRALVELWFSRVEIEETSSITYLLVAEGPLPHRRA